MLRRFAIVAIVALALGMAAQVAYAVPSIPSDAFQSVDNCGCHSSFQVQWAESMHAKALTDPIFQHELELAMRATDGALGPYCNSCHAPVAVMAGELTGLDHSELSAAGANAVFCDFCHQVTGRTGDRPGNASYALDSPDGTKRAQLDDAKSPYHLTAYSAFHESAEFCGNCHDVFHPTNGLPLEATYTEWKNSPYAAEGIVFQDCHMTPGPGVTRPNPGKAAAFGADRQHIYLMTFAGGNVGLGDADRAEERLQAAAEVRIETPEYIEAGSKGEIEVQVENVGAGHMLPTGLTELRQMWLEVTLVDSEGVAHFVGEHHWGTELADAEGNHPVPLWEAVAIAVDDRIPPRETVSYAFEVGMPADGIANIDAALYYRSAPEEVAEAAHVELPTTTMAAVRQPLFGSAEAAAEAAKAAHDALEGGASSDVQLLVMSVVALAVIGFIILMGLRSRTKV